MPSDASTPAEARYSSSLPSTRGGSWSIYRRLMMRALEHRKRVFVAMTCLALGSLSSLAIPWLAGSVFKHAALEQDSAGVIGALVLVLFAAAVMALARFIAEDQIGFVSLKMVEKLRVDLATKLMKLPLSYHARSKTGESVSRTSSDVALLQGFTYDSMFSVGSDVLQITGSIIALFYLHWQLTLILIAIVPISALGIGVTSKWVRRRLAQAQARHAEMTGLLTEQLVAMPAIQAFDAVDHERNRFATSAEIYTRESKIAVRIGAGTRGLINFLGMVAIVVVLLTGLGTIDLKDKLALEGLITFAFFASMIAEPLTRLTKTMFEIQRALAAGTRVFEIIDQPMPSHEGTQSIAEPFRGDIRFQGISFAYRADEPILRDVDLRIVPKDNLAIVGASGSGKSTLANLLVRFIEPTLGTVTLDGISLGALNLSELRARIGWMGQDPLLISGTVADNIRYGKRDATIEEIQAAAHMVAADEFIRELPGGYEAMIGERGVDLSGGQRARIAMARVVVRSPEIVIFDESTASLDTDTEMLLWRRLRSWMSRRTTIIIAHRFLTILDLPRIVVIEDGRIVGDGNAHSLDKTCVAFRRLFAEQMNLSTNTEGKEAA